MTNWIVTNKDLLTACIAIAGFVFSVFSIFRNYSIEKAKIKIKPTPIFIKIRDFSGKADDKKLYFHFEVINKSIFPVTVKDASVKVRKQWQTCYSGNEESPKTIRIDARDVETYGVREGYGELTEKDIEEIKVTLSDDKSFLLNGNKLRKLMKS